MNIYRYLCGAVLLLHWSLEVQQCIFIWTFPQSAVKIQGKRERLCFSPVVFDSVEI